MRPIEYIRPGTTEKALAALAENSPNATPLAGGTDLLVELKHPGDGARILVDLSDIAELKGIEITGDGLRIGAMVSHTEIMESPLIKEHMPAAIDAAWTIGAVQTRNMGTIGGNLVTCVPSLDSGPVLVALDALVTVAGTKGRRQMPIEDFFVGPRRTALTPDEILVDIVIPKANLGKSTSFRKFGLRKGQALALVNVAAAVSLKDNKIAAPRIALGAVAPVVIHAAKAEKFLDGKSRDDDSALEMAGELAAEEAKPIDDFRASANYRRELIKVLTRRCLEDALAGAS